MGGKHYAINSLLYLWMIKDKYIQMYNKFIIQLHMYAEVVRILAEGYLPISLIAPFKLKEILDMLKTTIRNTNADNDIVI